MSALRLDLCALFRSAVESHRMEDECSALEGNPIGPAHDRLVALPQSEMEGADLGASSPPGSCLMTPSASRSSDPPLPGSVGCGYAPSGVGIPLNNTLDNDSGNDLQLSSNLELSQEWRWQSTDELYGATDEQDALMGPSFWEGLHPPIPYTTVRTRGRLFEAFSGAVFPSLNQQSCHGVAAPPAASTPASAPSGDFPLIPSPSGPHPPSQHTTQMPPAASNAATVEVSILAMLREKWPALKLDRRSSTSRVDPKDSKAAPEDCQMWLVWVGGEFPPGWEGWRFALLPADIDQDKRDRGELRTWYRRLDFRPPAALGQGDSDYDRRCCVRAYFNGKLMHVIPYQPVNRDSTEKIACTCLFRYDDGTLCGFQSTYKKIRHSHLAKTHGLRPKIVKTKGLGAGPTKCKKRGAGKKRNADKDGAVQDSLASQGSA